MNKTPIFSALLLLMILLTGCRSGYERFREEAPKAGKVIVQFYEDVESRTDFKGLKVTADQPERVAEIAAFVKDSSLSESPCSPVGHVVFTDQEGQPLFDLPFCLTDRSAYLTFSNSEHRPLTESGTSFLRKHYQTFEAVGR